MSLLGRLLGFFREWSIAHTIGSNGVTDAYYAASTLPDLVNYLVAGGVIGTIFIPIFAQYISDEHEDEAWYVFSTVLTFLAVLLTILITAGEIYAPQLARMIAPGFDADSTRLVVRLTRILLPAQLFLCTGGLLSAVQYAKGRFLIPSLATILYNIVLIPVALAGVSRFGIASYALGAFLGVFFGFFLLQACGVSTLGGKFVPNLNLSHPGFRKFGALALPMMLALSIDVTDMWVIRWFGSFLNPPSITWLTFARYLAIIPVAVVGQAVGTGSFSHMAQLHAECRYDEVNSIIADSLRLLMVIMLPLSAITIALSKPLVHFVFSHTQFTAHDYDSTATAFSIFGIAMFSRCAMLVVSRGFNAAHDTLTPAWIGTLLTFLSLPLYWFFAKKWQYIGLATTSSIVAGILAGVLFVVLLKRSKGKIWPPLAPCFAKMIAVSGCVGFACWLMTAWLCNRVRYQTMLGAMEIIAIVGAFGICLILVMGYYLRVKELRVIWSALRGEWLIRAGKFLENDRVRCS
jgi:putative peptidoglycan lipid II flippase